MPCWLTGISHRALWQEALDLSFRNIMNGIHGAVKIDKKLKSIPI